MEEIVGYVRCAYCGQNKVPYPFGPLEESDHPVTDEPGFFYACADCGGINRLGFRFNRLLVEKVEVPAED